MKFIQLVISKLKKIKKSDAQRNTTVKIILLKKKLKGGLYKLLTVKYGDCLSIMSTIEDNSIDLILCDLPYG